MAIHDFWIERLSDHLDGGLSADEARAVEEHLDACADCRAVADDLAEVRRRARALGGVAPGRDLWPGIRDRLGPPSDVVDLTLRLEPPPGLRSHQAARGTRRRALPAAAVVALAVGAGVVGWGLRAVVPGAAPVGVGDGPVAEAPGAPVALAVSADGADGGDDAVAAQVAELERLLASGTSSLDPATVRILRENLLRIETAVAESRAALVTAPENTWVQDHLQGAVERRSALLRQAAALLAADD